MRSIRAIIVLAITCGCGHSGAGSNPAELRAAASAAAGIDYFCDHLALITKDAQHRRLFATIAANSVAQPWREYENENKLQAQLQTLGSYVVAEFWKRDDGAVLVQTTAASDTGDWNQSVHYCYRADGSLARTEFTRNSFVTDEGMRGTRVRHFAGGRQISVKSETRDLSSGDKRSEDEFDAKEPIYPSLSALPFAAQLQ
jgi:hypothetical protein